MLLRCELLNMCKPESLAKCNTGFMDFSICWCLKSIQNLIFRRRPFFLDGMSDYGDCVSLSSLSVKDSLKEEPVSVKVQVLIPRCRMAESSLEIHIRLQQRGCTYVLAPIMSFYLCGILFIIFYLFDIDKLWENIDGLLVEWNLKRTK